MYFCFDLLKTNILDDMFQASLCQVQRRMPLAAFRSHLLRSMLMTTLVSVIARNLQTAQKNGFQVEGLSADSLAQSILSDFIIFELDQNAMLCSYFLPALQYLQPFLTNRFALTSCIHQDASFIATIDEKNVWYGYIEPFVS